MPLKMKLGRLAIRLAIFFIWFLPFYYLVVPLINHFFLPWGWRHGWTHRCIVFWTVGTAIAVSILPIAVVRWLGAQYAQRHFPYLGLKILPLKEEIKETLNIVFIFIGAYIGDYLLHR